MKREGEIVTVGKKNPNLTLTNIRDPEVGYFRLDKGQTVREVK